MMARELLVFALLALAYCIGVSDAEPKFRSDYKYLTSTKAFYKHHKTNVPWAKAKETCELEGTTLYYPENGNEVDAVKTLYRDNIWIWLGVSRQANGQIKTVDGRDISEIHHKWDRDEPNNLSGAEDCIVLMDDAGKINDYHCHALYSFVCKIDSKDVDNTIVHVAVPPVKKAPVGRRNFYRYHANPETWEDAKQICAEYASTLVFPEDEVEAGSLLDYTNQTYWRNWIWVGASKSSTSKFSTVDGRVLEDVYVNWGPREPVNNYGNENCVVLCRDGSYRSQVCDDYRPFICRSSVFVSALVPQRGLMDPAVLKNPYELFTENKQNHSLSNCYDGPYNCDTSCGKVDKESKSHSSFGTIVADQLKNFPSTKKMDAMYSIMRVIDELWSVTETECKKVDQSAIKH